MSLPRCPIVEWPRSVSDRESPFRLADYRTKGRSGRLRRALSLGRYLATASIEMPEMAIENRVLRMGDVNG